MIRIGRAEDNDIVIRQPSVSRTHSELHWQGGRWVLMNRSRLGSLFNGLLADNFPLETGDSFQLGSMGPILRLDAGDSDSSIKRPSSVMTVGGNMGIGIEDSDEKKMEQQVEAVAGTDYFQNLQRLAKQFKDSDQGQGETTGK